MPSSDHIPSVASSSERPRPLPVAGAAAPLPPAALPLSHFACSLAWLAVAAIGLPWVAPRVAQGQVFDPAVLALVHTLVLGVVATAISGALLQFVPGGLGVPLKSVRVGWVGLVLHQAGVIVLVSGFVAWRGWAQALGWVLVFGAVGAVSWNVLRVRRHSVHGRQVGLFISVAHSALGVAMAIGAARIGETLGWWHVDRLSLLAAHAMLGAVGFGTLTALGVGSRMIPTFIAAPGDDRRWLNAILALATAGLTLFTTGALGGWWWCSRSGGALLVAAGCTAVALGRRWFNRRTRTLDAAAWHVAVAFAGLGVATVIGTALLVGDPLDLSRWGALLVALVLGWLVTLVIGVMLKIGSHLGIMWIARARAGTEPPPTPASLFPAGVQVASLVLLTMGWVSVASALISGSPTLARLGAVTWAGGAMLAVALPARVMARTWSRLR